MKSALIFHLCPAPAPINLVYIPQMTMTRSPSYIIRVLNLVKRHKPKAINLTSVYPSLFSITPVSNQLKKILTITIIIIMTSPIETTTNQTAPLTTEIIITTTTQMTRLAKSMVAAIVLANANNQGTKTRIQ